MSSLVLPRTLPATSGANVSVSDTLAETLLLIKLVPYRWLVGFSTSGRLGNRRPLASSGFMKSASAMLLEAGGQNRRRWRRRRERLRANSLRGKWRLVGHARYCSRVGWHVVVVGKHRHRSCLRNRETQRVRKLPMRLSLRLRRCPSRRGVCGRLTSIVEVVSRYITCWTVAMSSGWEEVCGAVAVPRSIGSRGRKRRGRRRRREIGRATCSKSRIERLFSLGSSMVWVVTVVVAIFCRERGGSGRRARTARTLGTRCFL
ncbi:hypothetical protein GGR56DRAFT_616127, partial [Xylariaceae sp. FL0804]